MIYIPKNKHHIQVGYMNNKPPKRGNLQNPGDGGQMAFKAEGGFMSLEHRRGKKRSRSRGMKRTFFGNPGYLEDGLPGQDL